MQGANVQSSGDTSSAILGPDGMSAASIVHSGSPGLLRAGRLMLGLGAINLGGRSSVNLLFEELRRHGQVVPTDWLEGMTLARVLPGSTGVSGAIFFMESAWGLRTAALCLVPYALPGVLIALGLSALAFSAPHPGWVAGAMEGFGAGGLGLLFTTTWRSLGGSRSGRFGLVFAMLAFVAHGLLEFNILLVLFTIGAVSLACNRPQGGTK